MKTYIKNLKYFFIALLVLFSRCKKDNPDQVEEIRDLSEQTIADNLALIEYLETHFYNYDDFENNPDKYPIEITLDTITEDNINKTPLIDQVTKKTIELINGDDKINVPSFLFSTLISCGGYDNFIIFFISFNVKY